MQAELLRAVLDDGIPYFGICFGNQILGKALGFGTYKLKYGHRGINQPVMDRTTGKVEVTAHNHGFAVDAPLDRDTETPYGTATVSHVCLNDDVVEGLEVRRDGRLVAFSVQYHPEAAAGPHDAAYLFDRFVDLMTSARTPRRRRRCGLMPKRDDITSVLVIGSGPIVIGQACEFDYSGTQACRVLREEGIRVILVNSNPATIMTDPEFADATYVEPITPEIVEKIIAKERPDAVLATLGGQTALNCAMELHERGILEKYDCPLIGANVEAIMLGEDREKFKGVVERCGAESARSFICHSMDEVLVAAADLGYPVVVRPSFTMGGLGSGFAHDEEELRRIAGAGLQYSPVTEVLLEESILGWKEYELEVMRDHADNVVVVCSIENLDPMGVHTGDSITVAPALTLTDREYQRLRDIGIAIIREVGVDTGGCNIQFAVNPADGRIIVIEMNPRVSRSSALASKATGFPIAKIAAKMAIGYTLDEVPNDITRETPASFEPTLDYVVVKVPRFAFEKFPAADDTLTTTMKSVGEAMSIGRSFTEALQKALRSLEKKGSSFHWDGERPTTDEARAILDVARRPTDGRIVLVQQALRGRLSVEEVHEATGIDPWFLDQMALIEDVADAVVDAAGPDPRAAPAGQAARLQRRPDRRSCAGCREAVVRGVRHALGVRPVYKTVDTCAAEFAALTPYHYSTYDEETEVAPRERPAVLILGSGPNRIGQGVEFDYSCVHASFALRDAGYDTVMVNCNPETVSTDYDTQQPALLRAADPRGRARGGARREPRRADRRRHRAARRADPARAGQGAQGRGRADRRHLARGHRPRRGPRRLRPGAARGRPAGAQARHRLQRRRGGRDRPRDRLPGAGAAVVRARWPWHGDRLRRRDPVAATSSARTIASPDHPVLVDRFLDDAIEIDVDVLYDGTEMYLGGIMEHIEEAGIHSGDSSCTLPPVTLGAGELERVRESTLKLAQGIGVRGLMNVQFALAQDILYVLEANPRASRTVPFVAKATGVPLANAAARIMMGTTIAELRAEGVLPAHTDGGRMPVHAPMSVKEAVLPFKRFRTKEGLVVDSLLGPEMRSTGEVMGIDTDFGRAFAKAQLGAISGLPTKGTVFVSVANRDKRAIIFPVKRLVDLGFRIVSTSRHRRRAAAQRRSRPRSCSSTPSAAPRGARSSTGSTPARSTWSSTARAARARPRGPTATRSGRRPRRWTSRSSPPCSSSRRRFRPSRPSSPVTSTSPRCRTTRPPSTSTAWRRTA